MSLDERFMTRALELARSIPFTSPNPRVGAVIVRDGRVIAEGAHRGAGTAHAEAAALAGVDAAGATVYVTLEPCSHHGRTPPCAPTLAAAGVARVVAAMEDPDPKVRGAGFAHLRDNGVEVVTGVLEDEARRLNAGFVKQRTTGLPLVTMKLALSLDGRLSAPDGRKTLITGEAARARVHARRQEVDAVVVGSGTVLADDPELTVRAAPAARQPARVVLDARGRAPAGARIFERTAESVVVTTRDSSHDAHVAWKEAGAEVVIVPAGAAGGVDLGATLETFGRRGWHELYFEAGPTLARALLDDDLVDRLELHIAPTTLGPDEPAFGDVAPPGRRFRVTNVEQLGDDLVVELER